MKISIGSDHGGYALKEAIKKHLSLKDITVFDCGTNDGKTSVDYPDFALPAAQMVVSGEVDFGIVVCTTGIGVSVVANKVKGVRAALVTNLEQAKLTRMHNDANVLALGAINQAEEVALEIVDLFLATPFSGEERHARRVNKIREIEEK